MYLLPTDLASPGLGGPLITQFASDLHLLLYLLRVLLACHTYATSSLQVPVLLLLHPESLLLEASAICPPLTPYVHSKPPAAVALPHHVLHW